MTLLAQFAATGGGAANYIEDVFSTWLYTGNGSTQTITNGIDLAGKGGLVWFKGRSGSGGTWNNALFDTVRGTSVALSSNLTNGNLGWSDSLSSFGASGFTVGADGAGVTNTSANNYVSWTFREQPKFFDVVTYTGNGTTNNIAHSLASVPGMVIIKKTSTTSNWWTMNRDSSGNYLLGYLNTTGSLPQVWAAANTSTYLTSTTLNVNSIASVSGEDMNASGTTYVAYLFAHNAGGFGLTGTDNVISCGSWSGASQTVNLGYEPQYILWKRSDSTGDWRISDTMRGLTAPPAYLAQELKPNSSAAETQNSSMALTSTGFLTDGNTGTYIYIAIRRGPMKVPTTGTSVFTPITRVGTSAAATVTTGFVTDLAVIKSRASSIRGPLWFDRLRGKFLLLNSPSTAEELSDSQTVTGFDLNTGITLGSDNSPIGVNESGVNYVNWNFRRAPGFFDEVCYTGAFPSNVTVNHNLGVTPEFIITKARSTAGYDWRCYHSALGIGTTIRLNLNNAAAAGTQYVSVSSTNFVVGNSGDTDNSGTTYVSYLFATCPGVSKVGSYTGTGTTLQINCGFTAGSRFVLIKRTDSTGDWYVWDSARGIVAGNDPYLLLNSTAAEVTSTDYVDTFAAGFELTATAPAAINASGGTYIFLAIA